MSVPQLRFKNADGQEFPEWAGTTLGDVAEVKRGAASQHLNYVSDAADGIRLLRINDFLKNEPVYVEDTDDIKRFRVQTNDLLIAGTGATAGIVYRVPDEFNNLAYSYNAPRIRVTKAHYGYIYFYLISDIILKQQNGLFVGNAQPFLDTDAMRGFLVNLPSLPEQNKIANFLTAVDEKLSQLTRKYDLLTQYKKGVMQQIFSQELRFKDDDGQEFPEWQAITLGECASFYRGGSLSKSDIDPNGKYYCVHYGELFTIYSEIITSVQSKTNKSNTFKSEVGDILMPSSDVTPAGLAKASCIQKAGVVLGGDINVIRVNISIAPIFISYLLNFEKYKIIQLVSGTTVKHIYIKDIKSIELSIPTDKAEQTKVANFLTAIDDKIRNTQAQLEAVKQYKQGLLQQMFV